MNVVTKAHILKGDLEHYDVLKTYVACLNLHSSIHQSQ